MNLKLHIPKFNPLSKENSQVIFATLFGVSKFIIKIPQLKMNDKF
jgi:hypothetical protein